LPTFRLATFVAGCIVYRESVPRSIEGQGKQHRGAADRPAIVYQFAISCRSSGSVAGGSSAPGSGTKGLPATRPRRVVQTSRSSFSAGYFGRHQQIPIVPRQGDVQTIPGRPFGGPPRSCSEFTVWVVSDDLAERRQAVEHAAQCPGCARVLSGHQELQDRVTFWREQARAPEHLEDKIRQAIAEVPKGAAPGPIERTRSESGTKFRARLWRALAASFLVGIGLGIFKLPIRSEGPQETRLLLAAADLKIAEAEEKAQIRAIFDLEARADRVLARANETEDDVRGFVDQNPGHPRARTLLRSLSSCRGAPISRSIIAMATPRSPMSKASSIWRHPVARSRSGGSGGRR